MTTEAPNNRTVTHEEAIGQTVGEVMIRAPKTLPAAVTVADVRRRFGNPTCGPCYWPTATVSPD
jgi:hypothetical protein